MGKNKQEVLVFSMLTCFLMVTCMTVYNAFLYAGVGSHLLTALVAPRFVMMLAIAFIIDWFVVAPVVKGVVMRFVTPQTPLIKKILLISAFMVLGMCTAMSLVALLVVGYQGAFITAYIQVWSANFIFALPLQLLLVGPVVRQLFLVIYPSQLQA